ncbi:Nup53p-like protein, partial [Metarhizium majus ARSEF 297]
MAPLILHNVPDEECYVGDDGIKRPYAMYFNQNDAHTGTSRSRRSVAETGSFGKSTRRSRSRTGTPARSRENPTLAAADKLFGDWVSNQAAAAAPSNNQRKSSGLMQDDAPPQRVVKSTPVEVILRGYRSSVQQYAAISHYEELAGAILEDYPRDPPASQRRYKSELRDPALTRRRKLSPEERALVNRADGGEHWVKVTFESTEAANDAIYASPQRILGYLVFAEQYRGIPPAKDEACPDVDSIMDNEFERAQSMPATMGTPRRKSTNNNNNLPPMLRSRLIDMSPSESKSSSQTLDTATLTPSHTSSATMQEAPGVSSGVEPMELQEEDGIFCRRIPTARRARLLPAEQALLPQQSVMQRFVNAVPFIKWFSGSMIGNEVPRTETGEFDWGRASLYWKIIWWLDATFGLFKGDVYSVDKDD